VIERYTRPEMGRLWTDQVRWETILEVELLAAEAQARRGRADRRAVRLLRRNAKVDVRRIGVLERTVKHDVIAFLTQIEERVGPAAKALHAGLTSSDVLDTALAVQLRKSLDLLIAGTDGLLRVLRGLSLRYADTPMAGRTHGVHAEPITFGFKVAGWFAEMKRHRARLAASREEISFGKLSGAVGTFAHNDPAVEAEVCRKLGLRAEPLSTQVVPRDRHARCVQTLALAGAGLERIAVEIRHLQRTEVLEAEEPFTRGQKGSSAMPHKRNPVACENVAGLARLLRGYASAALENVALWHERDISHSSVERVILPDAAILLDYMLHRMTQVLSGLQVYPERMRANLEKTAELSCSQRVVLALARTGLPKQKAYEIVQAHAQEAWRLDGRFRARVAADPRVSTRLSAAEIAACFDLKPFFKNIPGIVRRALT
jgi:adenylosuccinate lyase